MQHSTWKNPRGTKVTIRSSDGQIIRADLCEPNGRYHKLASDSPVCKDIQAAIIAGDSGPTRNFGYVKIK